MAVAPVGSYRVRRPFDMDGRRVVPGEILDVTDMKNGWQLIDRGYLVALDSMDRVARQLPTTASADVPDGSECPKCGAFGDEPCVSRTGRQTARHTARA